MPSTIKRRLCALRLVHSLLELPDSTTHNDVRLALRRACRAKSMRPRQAKDLTRDYFDQFIASEPNTPWGLRNRALFALGYELLTRRSELVALTLGDLELPMDGTLRVIIRPSKSDQFGQGRISFTSTQTAGLVQDWLSWRGDEIQPLFCPIYRGHPVDRALDVSTVERVVKIAAKRIGLSPEEVAQFSGHSMRVGAAQGLLKNGFDTAVMMRLGGWKSVNVLARYLEHAERNVWA